MFGKLMEFFFPAEPNPKKVRRLPRSAPAVVAPAEKVEVAPEAAMMATRPACPACNSPKTHKLRDVEWRCVQCGHQWLVGQLKFPPQHGISFAQLDAGLPVNPREARRRLHGEPSKWSESHSSVLVK